MRQKQIKCIHICRYQVKSNIDFNVDKKKLLHTSSYNQQQLVAMPEHNVAIDWCGHFDGFKQWLEFPLQAVHCIAPLYILLLYYNAFY